MLVTVHWLSPHLGFQCEHITTLLIIIVFIIITTIIIIIISSSSSSSLSLTICIIIIIRIMSIRMVPWPLSLPWPRLNIITKSDYLNIYCHHHQLLANFSTRTKLIFIISAILQPNRQHSTPFVCSKTGLPSNDFVILLEAKRRNHQFIPFHTWW